MPGVCKKIVLFSSLFFVTVFIIRCSELRKQLESIDDNNCLAAECHVTTSLNEYPPTSGSHSVHLSRGYTCIECHYDYGSSTSHMNGTGNSGSEAPDIVNFGNSINQEGAYDTAAKLCINTYCHGGKFINGGGSDTTPEWGNSSTAVCGACHEITLSSWTASRSHYTHVDTAGRGPTTISVCSDCHTVESSPNHVNQQIDFTGGMTLAATGICDSCHSPDGHFDGVNDLDSGAKANWGNGIYNGNSIISGKERWCIGCHDNGTSNLDSVDAPDISGDNSTYGYYINGHKSRQCTDCHDPDRDHIDGVAKSFGNGYTVSSYNSGYRLKEINGDYALVVPPTIGGYFRDDFALCFYCHDELNILGVPSDYGSFGWVDNPQNYGLQLGAGAPQTNFRNEQSWAQVTWNWAGNLPTNLHWDHIGTNVTPWDIDFSGTSVKTSCVTCHNPHGTVNASSEPTLRMTKGDMNMQSDVYNDGSDNYSYGYVGSDQYMVFVDQNPDLSCGFACHSTVSGKGDDPPSSNGTRYYRSVLDLPMPQ